MDFPLKILIVAGEAADRKRVRTALSAPGLPVEVSEADGGAAGLSALRNYRFDCALLDHRLPDVAGLDVLRAARTAGVATPLILLTDDGDEGLAVEVMRAGANDYLAKSLLDRDLLGHAVRHVVRLHRARTQARPALARSAESESQFRFLAESIPQIVFTADADGASSTTTTAGWRSRG